jgi:hypothetical protein
MAHHASALRKGRYVLKAADTDGVALDAAQLRAIEKCFDILRLDMTVPMKGARILPLCRASAKSTTRTRPPGSGGAGLA